MTTATVETSEPAPAALSDRISVAALRTAGLHREADELDRAIAMHRQWTGLDPDAPVDEHAVARTVFGALVVDHGMAHWPLLRAGALIAEGVLLPGELPGALPAPLVIDDDEPIEAELEPVELTPADEHPLVTQLEFLAQIMRAAVNAGVPVPDGVFTSANGVRAYAPTGVLVAWSGCMAGQPEFTSYRGSPFCKVTGSIAGQPWVLVNGEEPAPEQREPWQFLPEWPDLQLTTVLPAVQT